MKTSKSHLVLIFLFAACGEPELPHSFPVVQTDVVTNISSNGATFNASIKSVGKDQDVSSYGFLWGSNPEPQLYQSRALAQKAFNRGPFHIDVHGDLRPGGAYYVRAFVTSQTDTVFGNVVTFQSKGSNPPVITSIEPDREFSGNEITIRGENFSNGYQGNKVKIGATDCQVLYNSQNEIRVKVPFKDMLIAFDVSVTTAGQTGVAAQAFTMLGPRIVKFSKTNWRVGDIIDVEGEFLNAGSNHRIYLNWNATTPKVISPTKMEYVVPDYPNFNHYPVFATNRPGGAIYQKTPEYVHILDSWKKEIDSTPLALQTGYTAVAVGQRVFVMGGTSTWEYDALNHVWTARAEFPGAFRILGSAYAHGGKVYYGFGTSSDWYSTTFNDIWIYDIANDTWNLLGDAPLAPRHSAASMALDGYWYVGFGPNKSDLWKFDPLHNTWSEVDLAVSRYYVSSFAIGDKGYFIDTERVTWQFDPATGQWTSHAAVPSLRDSPVATSSASKGYVIITNSGRAVYEFDPQKNRWIQRQRLDVYLNNPPQFALFANNKLIYCFGPEWHLEFD